jgi:hypothetical protein
MYLSEFAKFFNTSVLSEIARFGKSDFITYVLLESGFLSEFRDNRSFSNIYNKVYQLLFSDYRCEYIYKNSIVNQVLIGKHSPATSTLFSEFKAGNSYADVLILNGTSSVYEIKTEYDNFDRLENQLSSYFQVFDRINVVTYPSALLKIEKFVDKRVGLLTLSNNGELITEREPISNIQNVNPATIFDSLRMSEYMKAIKKHFGYLPHVPNTLIYKECKVLFEQIPPEESHQLMVELLKTRKQLFIKNLLLSLPNSLKLTCLNSNLTQSQWRQFELALQSNFS